jgi:histidinol-phosphate phosphatase family protein
MRAAAPPVFLDRDGTLIVEKEYLSDPAEVSLESGVVEGLAKLQAHGHSLIVLSNQSGIGRGLYREDDAHRVNARVAGLLRGHGIEILAWYLCPHAPEARCGCRKPAAGMALAASRDWNLPLAHCYVIGDKRADLELADAIGGCGILLTTGHGADAAGWAAGQARPVFDSLLGAAEFIVGGTARGPGGAAQLGPGLRASGA